MDNDFEFAIGDIVYHRSWLHSSLKFRGRPTPMFVLEQHSQRCAGGIQRHYRCRYLGDLGNLIEFNEIELVAADAVDVVEMDAFYWLTELQKRSLAKQDFELASAVTKLIDVLDNKQDKPEAKP